ARLDAVFLSPHKFLGGPGSAGLLIFDESLYPHDLAPSVGGGGTVRYVNADVHDYLEDVEARETAGTPGLYQVLRAAYALDVKRSVGVDVIRDREHAHLERVLDVWGSHDRIDILGPDAIDRLSIVSFNVLDGRGRVLHPRFVTVLLDDLFGVQSRAGCSCAGPYGHHLLGIGAAKADRFRSCITDGIYGLRPGWARVGFHYSHDDDEVGYLLDAVAFVADHGARFLSLYTFEVESGAWIHRDGRTATPRYGLDALPVALEDVTGAARKRLFESALEDAHRIAAGLPDLEGGTLPGEIADLQFFAVPA
ncbi:aminotransferase class V-fold PLP-dependent enzyme, partial [Rubrivirga sp.]|uniref:aminotransferase class V-fold PLP-dependent enzyme n=1 Tax=Rubrivirga sp. TaxID=1885344 RepID=UPI003C73CF74